MRRSRSRNQSPGRSASADHEPIVDLSTHVGEDRIAAVRVRFTIGEDIGLKIFSQAHPSIRCVVTAVQPLGQEHYLIEVEMLTSELHDYAEELAHMPAITSAIRQSPVGHRTAYLITLGLTPEYMHIASEIGALLRYPRVIEGGRHTLEVVARLSQIRELIRRLRRLADDVEILQFGRAPMLSPGAHLSPRQTALLHRALAAGYFDVPRRVTLTGFAKGLGRGKSSVSRALARIEKQLAESGAASATAGSTAIRFARRSDCQSSRRAPPPISGEKL